MIFFNVREKFCDSEKQLAKITSKYASLLLNGNIQVQNYPVSNVLIAWITVHELKLNLFELRNLHCFLYPSLKIDFLNAR